MSDADRLLVIDDKIDVLDFVTAVAELVGYRVATADNARRGLDLLDEFGPSLIILDLQMPDMDGVEVIRELARHGTRAQVLISSGMDNRVLASTEKLGLTQGLDMIGSLQKPLNLPDLEALLKGRLNQTREPTEHDLRQALEAGEFVVYYQPQADLRIDGGVVPVGVEALVRWNHPTLGLLTPNHFISLAEASGLIGALTQIVLRSGVQQLAAWRSQGMSLHLAVNLSPLLVRDLELPDQLAHLMLANQVPNSQLTLEITETAALQDPSLTRDILTRLRVKNFGLSLDDFGTGFSSLTHLYKMPFNELKIDCSLGTELPANEEARTMCRSIIDLAHNLGLTVCTEGVEQPETLEFLRESKCDRIQGFLLGRAMRAQLIPDAFSRSALELSHL